MKKFAVAATVAALATASSASFAAGYATTFAGLTGDFVISDFGTNTAGPTIPDADKQFKVTLTNVDGKVTIQVPPAGNYNIYALAGTSSLIDYDGIVGPDLGAVYPTTTKIGGGMIGTVPGGGILIDMEKGADGKFYLAQNRSAGGEAGIVVLNPDGTVAYDSHLANVSRNSVPVTVELVGGPPSDPEPGSVPGPGVVGVSPGTGAEVVGGSAVVVVVGPGLDRGRWRWASARCQSRAAGAGPRLRRVAAQAGSKVAVVTARSTAATRAAARHRRRSRIGVGSFLCPW